MLESQSSTDIWAHWCLLWKETSTLSSYDGDSWLNAALHPTWDHWWRAAKFTPIGMLILMPKAYVARESFFTGLHIVPWDLVLFLLLRFLWRTQFYNKRMVLTSTKNLMYAWCSNVNCMFINCMKHLILKVLFTHGVNIQNTGGENNMYHNHCGCMGMTSLKGQLLLFFFNKTNICSFMLLYFW